MVKTVFVTGGAGFIGRELTKKLLATEHQVVCMDLDHQFARHAEFFSGLQPNENLTLARGTTLDRKRLSGWMRGADTVVHLAAMLGVQRTEENRLRCLKFNVMGTDMVASACALGNVGHLIFASSSEVYGEPTRNPVKESDETKGKTVYAVSKLAGEELVKGYNQLFPKMNFTIARLFNTYGEGQVAQFVMARFVKAVLAGENPTLFGDGTQLRSYGHVDDIADGLIAVIHNPVSHSKTYNLGNSAEISSLKDLARKVIDILAPGSGLEVDILNSFEGSDRTREREVFARYCDNSLARRELGFNPSITLEEGIRRIAEAGIHHDDWPDRA